MLLPNEAMFELECARLSDLYLDVTVDIHSLMTHRFVIPATLSFLKSRCLGSLNGLRCHIFRLFPALIFRHIALLD